MLRSINFSKIIIQMMLNKITEFILIEMVYNTNKENKFQNA